MESFCTGYLCLFDLIDDALNNNANKSLGYMTELEMLSICNITKININSSTVWVNSKRELVSDAELWTHILLSFDPNMIICTQHKEITDVRPCCTTVFWVRRIAVHAGHGKCEEKRGILIAGKRHGKEGMKGMGKEGKANCGKRDVKV